MQESKNAAVRALKTGFIFEARSGYRLLFSDPESFHQYLQKDASLEELGRLALSSLDASRTMTIDEAKEAFSTTESRWESWTQQMMGLANIASQQKLFLKMAVCDIREADGVITLSPTIKRRGAAWEGRGAEFAIRVSRLDGPEAIGAALRAALEKCIPQVMA